MACASGTAELEPASEVRVGPDRPAEVSGVVAAADGGAWVLDDSGNPAVLHRIRPDGTVRTVTVVGVENVDWEELIDDHEGGAWIADVGDNQRTRATVALHHVELPGPGPDDGPDGIVARTITVTLPEGPRDIEAGFVWDGTVHLLTKEGHSATVYAVATDAGDTVTARAVTAFSPPGAVKLVTAAAVASDGTVLVRTYLGLWAYPPAAGAHPLDALVTATPCRLPVGPGLQGEAVAVLADDAGWVTIAEGEHPTLAVFRPRSDP